MSDDARDGDAGQTPDPADQVPATDADGAAPSDASEAPDAATMGGSVPPPPPPPTSFAPPTAGDLLTADSSAPTSAVEDQPVAPTRDKAGLTAALAAIGSGLGGSAAVIAATRSRHGAGGDLDWSIYGVAIGVTVLLLGLALGAAVAGRRTAAPAARSGLVTWPGVVGILSVALLLPVGLADADLGTGLPYLVGGVLTVLSVIGYVIVRRPAFAVVAVLGLGVVYTQGFDDLFGSEVSGDDLAVWVALAVTGFVVIITVLGWLLPSRLITSVTVGVIGVVGIAMTLVGMLAMRLIASFFQEPGMGLVLGMMSGGSEDGSESVGGFDLGGMSAVPADYERDVSIVLGLAAALAIIWAIAAVLTDHSGFTILVIAILATALPLATGVLAVQHPTWWVAALGAAGAAVLTLGVVFARRRAEPQTSDA